MGLFKKKAPLKYDRPRDESISHVFKKGNTITKLSFLVFGLGNIMNKQIVRGLIFLVLEILYFVYMILPLIKKKINSTLLFLSACRYVN